MVDGILEIDANRNPASYTIKPIPVEPEMGRLAYQVTRRDTGSTYHVILTPTGAQCDCPDWIFCRDGRDPKGCRHIVALRAHGLL